jgi:hypothetical protein
MQGRLPGTAPRALPVARPGAQRWRRRIAGWVVSGALALLAGPAAADALDDAGVAQERALLQFRLLVLEPGMQVPWRGWPARTRWTCWHASPTSAACWSRSRIGRKTSTA